MAKKKSIEDYFNYTQPDIDVPEWFKPTAKTKADSLPQTPMMSLLSAVIGPEEYEKEMGRQAARKKSWDQFEKEEFQRSGSKPIGLTTGTPAVDYYNNNPKPAPTYPLSRVIDHDAVDTGPAQYATMESAPVPVWSAPQPPVPDMYQQAVALDGKEPAATVAPMGPTIEINRGASQDPDPQNGGFDQGGYPNQVRLPHNPNAWDGSPIVRDTAGTPVASGTGPFIGLPTQNPALRSPNGGGKGGAGGK